MLCFFLFNLYFEYSIFSLFGYCLRDFFTVILCFFFYKTTIFCLIWTLLLFDECSILLVIKGVLFPNKIYISWIIFYFIFFINSMRFLICSIIKWFFLLPKESKIWCLFSFDTLIESCCKSYCVSGKTPTFSIKKYFQNVVKK